MKIGHVAVISLLLLMLSLGLANIAEASGQKLEGIVTYQNGVPIRGVKVNTWDGKTLRQAVSDSRICSNIRRIGPYCKAPFQPFNRLFMDSVGKRPGRYPFFKRKNIGAAGR